MAKADINYLASLEEISGSRNLWLCLLKKEITTLGFFIDLIALIGEPIKLGEWKLKVFFMMMSEKLRIR